MIDNDTDAFVMEMEVICLDNVSESCKQRFTVWVISIRKAHRYNQEASNWFVIVVLSTTTSSLSKQLKTEILFKSGLSARMT